MNPSGISQYGAGDNYLSGVSVFGETGAWAVGQYFNAAADGNSPLIERWDGHTWTRTGSPSPHRENVLTAVSADSAGDAWAVGTWNGIQVRSFVQHWDGHAWRVVPSLDPGRDGKGRPTSELTSVAALSPRDAWVAGTYQYKGGPYVPLLAHWNGTSWRLVPAPHLVKWWNMFAGLSAPAHGGVWAVGFTERLTGADQQAIAVHAS